MPMPDHENDDAVRVIQALDPDTRLRLHRMAIATGTHPFQLAAKLLHDILADDEAIEGIRPDGVQLN